MTLTEKSVDALRTQNPNHAFVYDETVSYRDGPLAPAELERIVSQVSACECLATSQRACLLFGRGSQTRGTYQDLAKYPGVRILWQGAFCPWWLRPLTVIAAAHGGLIQATVGVQAKPLLLRLATLAMVELYSFRIDLLDTVAQHVNQAKWRGMVGTVVGADPSYFTLGVDGDSQESATGLFAWSSWGRACPADLKASVA
jgi:hypothetical protein